MEDSSVLKVRSDLYSRTIRPPILTNYGNTYTTKAHHPIATPINLTVNSNSRPDAARATITPSVAVTEVRGRLNLKSNSSMDENTGNTIEVDDEMCDKEEEEKKEEEESEERGEEAKGERFSHSPRLWDEREEDFRRYECNNEISQRSTASIHSPTEVPASYIYNGNFATHPNSPVLPQCQMIVTGSYFPSTDPNVSYVTPGPRPDLDLSPHSGDSYSGRSSIHSPTIHNLNHNYSPTSGRSPTPPNPHTLLYPHEDNPIETTLDLSINPRSKSSNPPSPTGGHQPSDQPQPSASISPTVYNPFSMFSGLPLNPLFQERFKSPRVTSVTPSLYTANLPPHLLPWLISSQLQNFVHNQQASQAEGLKKGLLERGSGCSITPPFVPTHDERGEQPLDLSAKKGEPAPRPYLEEDIVSTVLDMKPAPRGRRRTDPSKRSYSEEELQAALNDIQSGKLGTRRAAVIYGIPRSTLRNKVYKLQSTRDQNKRLLDQEKEKLALILPDSTAHLQGSYMLPQRRDDHTRSNDDSSCEALKIILRKKMTEKLEELSHNSHNSMSTGDKQRILDSTLRYLCDNIPSLALNTNNKTTSTEILSSLSLYPQLQEFTHKIVEQRFHEEINKTNNGDNLCSANGYSSLTSGHHLNVPSYQSILNKVSEKSNSLNEDHAKQNSSHIYNVNSPTQTNLKDVIAQIINKKLSSDNISDELSTSKLSAPFLPLSVQRLDPSFAKINYKPIPDNKHSHQDINKKRAKSPSNSGGKGSRPKRGKYRNYDKANLLKAVQAVQNGEMSVHRAGSYYGVPHSTLEYKVKERHLHRGRSKKETGILTNIPLIKSDNDSSSPSSTISSSPYKKELLKTDTPDTTTRDMSSGESRLNEEISIIGFQPPNKKVKLSSEQEEKFQSLQLSSSPFLPGSFPFWNNASPILAPFLSSQYPPEPSLYASQVMSNFQKAASSFNKSGDINDLPSPNYGDQKNQKSYGNDMTPTYLSMGGSGSTSPPSALPNEMLLKTLLRRKMESHISETSFQWKTTSSETKYEDQERESNQTSQGLLTLKAILPSYMAAKNSHPNAFSEEHSIPSRQEFSPPLKSPSLNVDEAPQHSKFSGVDVSES